MLFDTSVIAHVSTQWKAGRTTVVSRLFFLLFLCFFFFGGGYILYTADTARHSKYNTPHCLTYPHLQASWRRSICKANESGVRAFREVKCVVVYAFYAVNNIVDSDGTRKYHVDCIYWSESKVNSHWNSFYPFLLLREMEHSVCRASASILAISTDANLHAFLRLTCTTKGTLRCMQLAKFWRWPCIIGLIWRKDLSMLTEYI